MNIKNYTSYLSTAVADCPAAIKASFIRCTYAHLAGAILFFIVIEFFLLNSPNAGAIVQTMLGGKWSWAIVIACFIGVSFIANWWASTDTSPGLQYLGLGLFVVAEAIVFMPLLYIASNYFDGIIMQAGLMTLLLFGGLTATVFITQKDFSFLQPVIAIGGLVALGVILASIGFGFELGILFSAIMVLFAAGSILYETSNVLHRFNPNQHVAASLALFASVALLFWYVLQILMSLASDD